MSKPTKAELAAKALFKLVQDSYELGCIDLEATIDGAGSVKVSFPLAHPRAPASIEALKLQEKEARDLQQDWSRLPPT